MLKIYEVYHKPIGYRDDDRAFVIAANPSQAKFLAFKEPQCKFHHDDYMNLRARIYSDRELINELANEFDITQAQWLFDNETNEDVLDDERRWFESQAL